MDARSTVGQMVTDLTMALRGLIEAETLLQEAEDEVESIQEKIVIEISQLAAANGGEKLPDVGIEIRRREVSHHHVTNPQTNK